MSRVFIQPICYYLTRTRVELALVSREKPVGGANPSETPRLADGRQTKKGREKRVVRSRVETNATARAAAAAALPPCHKIPRPTRSGSCWGDRQSTAAAVFDFFLFCPSPRTNLRRLRVVFPLNPLQNCV